MRNNEFTKYTSDEILQILIDFYNFQTNFDPEVYNKNKLTYQTTIKDWRSICDLVESTKLAKYYHKLFELETNESDLVNLLQNEKNTLKILCDYIAENASKEKINPILSLGSNCQEAAIFKTLKNKLEKKGIDTKDFKPSTNFTLFFDKHASELIEIISKLAPGTLSYYKIKDNIIGKLGAIILLFSIILLIISLLIDLISSYIIVPFAISITLLFIGNKINPSQYEIGGFHTIRDLIIGMKVKINSTD